MIYAYSEHAATRRKWQNMVNPGLKIKLFSKNLVSKNPALSRLCGLFKRIFSKNRKKLLTLDYGEGIIVPERENKLKHDGTQTEVNQMKNIKSTIRDLNTIFSF